VTGKIRIEKSNPTITYAHHTRSPTSDSEREKKKSIASCYRGGGIGHRLGSISGALQGHYKVIRKVLGNGIVKSMHASETNETISRPRRERCEA
jgi:hypothetical protein